MHMCGSLPWESPTGYPNMFNPYLRLARYTASFCLSRLGPGNAEQTMPKRLLHKFGMSWPHQTCHRAHLPADCLETPLENTRSNGDSVTTFLHTMCCVLQYFRGTRCLRLHGLSPFVPATLPIYCHPPVILPLEWPIYLVHPLSPPLRHLPSPYLLPLVTLPTLPSERPSYRLHGLLLPLPAARPYSALSDVSATRPKPQPLKFSASAVAGFLDVIQILVPNLSTFSTRASFLLYAAAIHGDTNKKGNHILCVGPIVRGNLPFMVLLCPVFSFINLKPITCFLSSVLKSTDPARAHQQELTVLSMLLTDSFEHCAHCSLHSGLCARRGHYASVWCHCCIK
jgi:hypothetical protein